MRKEPTDNYSSFVLLGNNIYDINFVNYLFASQNVSCYYCDKYKLHDLERANTLKNMAYYFGTSGPILIDDKGLKRLFAINDIPNSSNLPNLSSEDIINLIDKCLESDAVYVCNANGKLDKYTLFMLGYLMALKQEIFFSNDIDKSEWLMASISKKNSNGYKEVIQFPLEIIRTFAYPYLFKKKSLEVESGKYKEIIVDLKGNIGVDRNIEFNLQVENQEKEKNTISLLGSLRKQLIFIKEKKVQLEDNGYKVLAPRLSNIKTAENGFIIFEEDISANPIIIESDFMENCLKSESIIVCDKDGYIGNTVIFEIGYLLAKKKDIEFMEEPNELWLREVVDYFLKKEKIIKKKTKII